MTPVRRGMTLLEALVALVILGTVGVALLEVFASTARVATRAGEWSRAVAYAEEALENIKLDSLQLRTAGSEALPDGFTRRLDVRPWSQPGFAMVTVEVTIPDGGTHTLTRLWRSP